MKLITFLFSAISVIGLAQGLRCYSCYIQGCSDPFNATATGVNTVTCGLGYDYCGKQSVTIDSEKLMFRECAYAVSRNTMNVANVTNRADVTYGKIYTCTHDLCNGANSIGSGIGVALVSLIGLAYITL